MFDFIQILNNQDISLDGYNVRVARSQENVADLFFALEVKMGEAMRLNLKGDLLSFDPGIKSKARVEMTDYLMESNSKNYSSRLATLKKAFNDYKAHAPSELILGYLVRPDSKLVEEQCRKYDLATWDLIWADQGADTFFNKQRVVIHARIVEVVQQILKDFINEFLGSKRIHQIEESLFLAGKGPHVELANEVKPQQGKLRALKLSITGHSEQDEFIRSIFKVLIDKGCMSRKTRLVDFKAIFNPNSSISNLVEWTETIPMLGEFVKFLPLENESKRSRHVIAEQRFSINGKKVNYSSKNPPRPSGKTKKLISELEQHLPPTLRKK